MEIERGVMLEIGGPATPLSDDGFAEMLRIRIEAMIGQHPKVYIQMLALELSAVIGVVGTRTREDLKDQIVYDFLDDLIRAQATMTCGLSPEEVKKQIARKAAAANQ